MKNLVSVVVVTYNSSKFIEETLESVKSQSWKDIELIVTDDCSIDDTVDICKSWISKNGSRFIRTKIIEVDANTGVSANANRGLDEAQADWLCLPAGDDALCENCIVDNMNYVMSHPEIKVLFSKIDVYDQKFEKGRFIKTTPGDPLNGNSIFSMHRTADSQYRMLLISDRIHFTPSLFINKQTLKSVGKFDERFKLLEDYPLWLNLTKNGIRLNFMDKITVKYRSHVDAINNKGLTNIVNPNYFKLEKFRRIYIYPNLPMDVRLSQKFMWSVLQIFKIDLFNKKSSRNKLLKNILVVYLNPFKYLIWLRLKLNRELSLSEFYMN